MNTNPFRRRLAKALFRGSGWLGRIKTPQRVYKWNSDRDAGFEYAGRVWLGCRLHVRMLEKSMKLDPHCWDHWALVHDDCDPVPCVACGGCSSEPRDFLDHH